MDTGFPRISHFCGSCTGIHRYNATDIMGTHPVRKILKRARTGNGMVEYYSANPSTKTTRFKIRYVTDVDGTRVPGAGRYMEPGTVNPRG